VVYSAWVHCAREGISRYFTGIQTSWAFEVIWFGSV